MRTNAATWAATLAVGVMLTATACGDDTTSDVEVAPVTASDPAGDATTHPPQLDLVNTSIEVRGGNATFVWKVAGPLEALPADPDARYSWTITLTDDKRSRSISATRIGDRSTATIQFVGPGGSDLVDLPPPELVADTVRLTAPLKTLRWSGGTVTFTPRTYVKRGDAESVIADEMAADEFRR